MRKYLEIGGFIAAAVLIVFGIGAMVMAYQGRNTVRDTLSAQQIVGTPDMTPTLIKQEAQKAGLNVANLTIPSEAVAGDTINTGSEAHAFAQYMTIHTLMATGGQYYAQMPRYASPDGKGTNDPNAAVKVNGQPQDNPARNIWVTETALSTALQSSYMAENLANFGFVTGFALLLSGIGFGILAGAGALRNRDTALGFMHRGEAGHKAVPVS
jgi:hypothetical protein